MNALCYKKNRQNGAVLLVAMVFLILFGLIAASVYRGSIASGQAIGNMQWRTESINAANDAIDKLLSDPATFTNAGSIGAALATAPLTFDVNGDGISDVRTKFVNDAGPECKRSVPILSSELDVDTPEDVACMASGALSNTGLGITTVTGTGTSTAGIASVGSLCSNVEWSLTVQAVDQVTNTTVNVVQGVGVRVPNTAVSACL